MSDAVATTSSAQGLLAQRTRPKPSKKAARRAFWRTLALVRPHRRNMIWGMVLGLGVALTYAASLGGLYPTLQVVISEHSIRSSMLATAAK
jgi:hypothetical protein